MLAHERDYHLSKGDEHQKIVEKIIEDIASQGKGKFSRPEAMKILPPVSQFSHQWNPGSYPLGLRKFKPGTTTTKVSYWRVNLPWSLLAPSGTSG